MSTSLVEQCNLTVRMQLRRHARRTNTHSKPGASHRAAVASPMAFYHWCRIDETLHVTPAMELGVTNPIWNVGELIEQAQEVQLSDPVPVSPPPPGRPRLRMIRGRKP